MTEGGWKRENGRGGQKGCGESCRGKARCAAGGSIVPVNEDLGHCVQANL